MKKKSLLLVWVLLLSLILSGCGIADFLNPKQTESPLVQLDSLPPYSSSPYVALNGNVPFFTEEEIRSQSFESYSELDALGRCGVTLACIGIDLMPTEDRGSIGQVKPTGWQTVKYDVVDGKYLYNRCHLIGFQLSGENANVKNLITGTRYLNVDGMLPFENMVADFVKETEMHVMYRVTPIFQGQELVARGVVMEALSVEDQGEGIQFCVFCYNVQPGIQIDYATGESRLAEASPPSGSDQAKTYVLNTGTKKIHLPSCSSASSITEKNRKEVKESLDSLLKQGYSPCQSCLKQES